MEKNVLTSRYIFFTACIGCCKALRPRYKRLIDDIFPVDPEVRNNLYLDTINTIHVFGIIHTHSEYYYGLFTLYEHI